MTAQDLDAARRRVDQRQLDLEAARLALARVEHTEYADGLQRIADQLAPVLAGTAGSDSANLDNIARVLQQLRFLPTEQPGNEVAARPAVSA